MFTVVLRIGFAVGLLSEALCAEEIMYVDGRAPVGGDGSTWAQAFQYPQDALRLAAPGTQIRIAQGTYRPDRDAMHPDGTADRAATFTIPYGVVVEGGYDGLGAPDPNARDARRNQTILSGDIGVPGIRADNSYHVVCATGVSAATALIGVTVVDGVADGTGNVGGGMWLNDANIVIRDCRFMRNESEYGGGAVFVLHGTPKIVGCEFLRNGTQGSGGALSIHFSNAVVQRCVFRDNYAGLNGGAMGNNDTADPLILNCLFEGNEAAAAGGAVLNRRNPLMVNCTLVRNVAPIGSAVYAEAGVTTMVNSIAWGGADLLAGQVHASYCCVEGGFAGEGNINTPPLFCDPENGDWRLLAGSPCIDAGNSPTVPTLIKFDLDQNPRFFDDLGTADTGVGPGAIVDMGAFEYRRAPVGWRQVSTDGPDGRMWVGLVYDPVNAVTMLICGTDDDGVAFDDLWLWDGAGWVEHVYAPDEPHPSARWHPGVAYDPVRRKVVLFGGYNGVSYLNDLWEWDVITRTWTEIEHDDPSTPWPSARGQAAMSYAGGGLTCLVAGTDGDGHCFDETWVWDGTAWSQPATSNAPYLHPTTRMGCRAAYSPALDRVVLTHGRDPNPLGDTWFWDHTTQTWEVGPTGPAPRFDHGLSYGPAGVVVEFSGWVAPETWELEAGAWTNHAYQPGETHPSERCTNMAYDARRGVNVIFSGTANGGPVADRATWEYGLLRVGDLNGDGRVGFEDINPFVLALANPGGYATAFVGCNILAGDLNGDGALDFRDINPFVVLLTSPGE